VDGHGADGVLLTGVYGSGKSSVGAEIAYLLERRGEPYALLDLDYLSWAGTGSEDRAVEFGLMRANLAAVAGNYRGAGIRWFVLAYFVRDQAEVQGIREALGVPLRVVRLAVPLADIERRLAGDVTSGRRDDLREAAASLATGEGAGVEDVLIGNDRPVGVVAREVLDFLGWDSGRR
jgi:adenylylsulfate kinase